MNFGELFVQLGAIGNSKEVKAFGNAVKKAGKALDEYDKKLKNTQKDGDGVTTSIKDTIGAIGGIIGAVAGAYWALDRLTDSLAKQNLQWLNLARQSDIALSTFQKWGTIGKIVGVDNAAQQLDALNQKIFNLKLTGEGAKGFQMAGIMPTTSEDVLEQLRRRISGMSNTTASYLLQQMGLDPKMITLLRMGRKEWEEYIEVANKFTLKKEQRENIDYYNRQLEVARIQFGYLKDRLVYALMPAFVKFTRFVASATQGLAICVNWIIKSDSPIAKFTRGILGVTAAVKGLQVALMLLTAHPIIAALTAALGVIMLIADDINHYMNGGGSLIGVIAKGLEDLDLKGFIDFETPEWLKLLIQVINIIRNTPNMVKDFFSLKNVDSLLESQGIDPKTGKRIDDNVDKSFQSNMSPGARYFTNNRNQTNTLYQQNYINTTETESELENSLRFFQQRFAG